MGARQRGGLGGEREETGEPLRRPLERGWQEAGERGSEEGPDLRVSAGHGDVPQRLDEPLDREQPERDETGELASEGGAVELAVAGEDDQGVSRGGTVGAVAGPQTVCECEGERGADRAVALGERRQHGAGPAAVAREQGEGGSRWAAATSRWLGSSAGQHSFAAYSYPPVVHQRPGMTCSGRSRSKRSSTSDGGQPGDADRAARPSSARAAGAGAALVASTRVRSMSATGAQLEPVLG
jgi:hypothetical protein